MGVRASVGTGLLSVLALLAGACGDGVPDAPAASVAPESPTPAPSPTTIAAGVSTGPCPQAPPDDELGCIALGALADISEGPFSALGASVLRGAQAFWQRVNARGGIAGAYRVDLETFVRDTRYDPTAHAAAAAEIGDEVAAIAVSFGTEQTLAALDVLGDAAPPVVPASLWSGWGFDARALEAGTSYCLEAVGGLDWFVGANGPVDSVYSVHHGDLYGRDSQGGVALWAGANEVPFDPASDVVVTPRTTQDTNQDDTVAALVARDPAVVLLATGPVEAAEIVSKARAEGYEGRFLGSVPTWNPALLETRAADALEDVYHVVLPWQPWGGAGEAHVAMQESAGDDVPSNEGFVFGWMIQYPLLHALEAAAAAGTLDHAGIRSALDGQTVDFEGAAPAHTYRDGDAEGQREVTVAMPSGEGALGTTVVAADVVGPTSAALTLDEPCATP